MAVKWNAKFWVYRPVGRTASTVFAIPWNATHHTLKLLYTHRWMSNLVILWKTCENNGKRFARHLSWLLFFWQLINCSSSRRRIKKAKIFFNQSQIKLKIYFVAGRKTGFQRNVANAQATEEAFWNNTALEFLFIYGSHAGGTIFERGIVHAKTQVANFLGKYYMLTQGQVQGGAIAPLLKPTQVSFSPSFCTIRKPAFAV